MVAARRHGDHVGQIRRCVRLACVAPGDHGAVAPQGQVVQRAGGDGHGVGQAERQVIRPMGVEPQQATGTMTSRAAALLVLPTELLSIAWYGPALAGSMFDTTYDALVAPAGAEYTLPDTATSASSHSRGERKLPTSSIAIGETEGHARSYH